MQPRIGPRALGIAPSDRGLDATRLWKRLSWRFASGWNEHPQWCGTAALAELSQSPCKRANIAGAISLSGRRLFFFFVDIERCAHGWISNQLQLWRDAIGSSTGNIRIEKRCLRRYAYTSQALALSRYAFLQQSKWTRCHALMRVLEGCWQRESSLVKMFAPLPPLWELFSSSCYMVIHC